jgi:glycosyltransferase involved in cell wall biosynthesis
MPDPTRDQDTPAPAPSLALFIPAYNEEPTIASSVQRALAVLEANFARFELIVVDDGSTDGTSRVLAPLLSDRVRVRRFDPGHSWRENLGHAMAESDADVVGFVDADLSPDIEALPRLVATLVAEQADVVTGSRYLPGSELTRRRYRKVASHGYSALIHVLFGTDIRDYQCGLKVFRRASYRTLHEAARYAGFFERGWFWDAELLIRATLAGMRVIEMPIRWVESPRCSYVVATQIKLLGYILSFRTRV